MRATTAAGSKSEPASCRYDPCSQEKVIQKIADLEANAHVYDVKFWPYSKPGSDPIFAVIETTHVIILLQTRPVPGSFIILIDLDLQSSWEEG